MNIRDYKVAVAIEAFEREREAETARAARQQIEREAVAPHDQRVILLEIPGRESAQLQRLDDLETETTQAEATDQAIRLATPPKFDFLYAPALGATRYRVAYGGRGSAKSWQFARALLVHGMRRRLRILCAREYQNSIRDSVHRLLSTQVRALTLGAEYAITESTITGRNGTEFIFKGIRKDIDQIKSTEGIDLCWVEEAQSVSEESWKILTPTIRAPGSEIWVTFNPGQPSDATYKRFVIHPPTRAVVRKVTFEDNPWLPDVLRDEEREMLALDPEGHAHVWRGEPWARSDAQVLAGKWCVADFTPAAGWEGPYYGADWGFAMDPTVIVKLWIADNRLYVERDDGKPQLDNDQTATLFRSVVADERSEIRADSEDASRINEMRKRGLSVVPAKKWPGSVEAGIAYLRTFRNIVIHPHCKRAEQEARLWRYKVDKRTDEVLPSLVDGSDHVWDAVRYALSPMIRSRRERREAPPSITQSVG